MTKREFIEYISTNNTGFYKCRKSHINNVSPNIINEIEERININNLTPIDFNDSLQYYLNNIRIQNTCKFYGIPIHQKNIYCSLSCKKI